MIEVVTDVSVAEEFVRQHPASLDSTFCLSEWMEENVVLSRGEDAALFEKNDDIYEGHYFFNSRGRDAVEAARDIISYVFTELKARAVVGIVPADAETESRKVRIFTRRLGFKQRGVIDAPDGRREIFVLLNEDF